MAAALSFRRRLGKPGSRGVARRRVAKAHGARRKDSSKEMPEDLKLSAVDMKSGPLGSEPIVLHFWWL